MTTTLYSSSPSSLNLDVSLFSLMPQAFESEERLLQERSLVLSALCYDSTQLDLVDGWSRFVREEPRNVDHISFNPQARERLFTTTGAELFILAVALKFNDHHFFIHGYSRHCHVQHALRARVGRPLKRAEVSEGFMAVDVHGRWSYLDRTEGMAAAVQSGQFRRETDPKKYQGPLLYSEDLW